MPGRAIGKLFLTLFLLVIEVFVTMLVYSWLNLRFIETFGYLVRIAGSVLEGMKSTLLVFMPGSVNAAYATLFGELGPKAVLLLMIGLVVATVIRGLAELMGLYGHG